MENKRKRISVSVSEDFLRQIEEAMQKTGIEPRSVFIRAAVNKYVQEVLKK